MKGIPKDKPSVKKIEKECWTREPVKGYHFSKGATFWEGDGPNEEGHGWDEEKYKKGKSGGGLSL